MSLDIEKIEKIVAEPASFNNKELIMCMDVISEEHEIIKQEIIKLTYQIDKLESSYGKVLNEYKNRQRL